MSSYIKYQVSEYYLFYISESDVSIMGVSRLQTYIEQHCPQAHKKIKISHLAAQYVEREGKIPVLLVDGNALLRRLYIRFDWVYGGQWKEYIEELKHFVGIFRQIGVQLIFMFDGSVGNTKRLVWVKRRIQNMKDIMKVFAYIKNKHVQPSRNLLQIPSGLSITTAFILKYELNVTVYHTIGEADREIFEFCLLNKCWGVLSQDSDFIIYDSGICICVQDLSVGPSDVKAFIYDRNTLCEHLGLHVLELPILASLMGTDILQTACLNLFHRRVTATPRDEKVDVERLVPMLATFIRQNSYHGNYFKNVGIMSRIVFPGSLHNRALFKESVNSFVGKEDAKKLKETGLPFYLKDPKQACFMIGQHGSGHIADLSQLEVADDSMDRKELSEALQVEANDDPNITSSRTDTSSGARPKDKTSTEPPIPNVHPTVLHMAKQSHVNSECLPLMYNVLSGKEVDSGAGLEDQIDPMVPPSSILYTPIRQRLFGLLLGVGTPEYNRQGRLLLLSLH